MSPPPKRARTRPVRTIMTRSTTRATSATTINDLFDDVLRETFGNMSASDLVVIADVCTIFRRNAQAEFASRYKKVFFGWDRLDSSVGAHHRFNDALYLGQLSPALRNFGRSIDSIRIETTGLPKIFGDQSWKFMGSIADYCSESLKELELMGIDFTPVMVRKLQSIFSRLEKLVLTGCSWKPEPVASQMFSYCSELHTLWLKDECPLEVCVNFPKLNTLRIFKVHNVSVQSIEHLLAVNPQLKDIEVGGSKEVTTGQMIESIVEYAPQIESIRLFGNKKDSSGFIESAEKLKRLTELKQLELNCTHESFSPVLREIAAACIALKDLRLYFFLWDDEFKNEIMKWKHLEIFGMAYSGNVSPADFLTIVRNMTDLTELDLILLNPLLGTDLVEIVRSAPKLRKFTFLFLERAIFTLDVDVFMQIRNVVANRKSPKLLLVIYGNNVPDVPVNVLKTNEDYLKIEYHHQDR